MKPFENRILKIRESGTGMIAGLGIYFRPKL